MKLLSLLSAAFLCACTVGGGVSGSGSGGSGSGSGGGSGDGSGGDDVGEGVVGTVEFAATPEALDLELGINGTAEVTLRSVDGYAGAVALDVAGGLDSWNVTVSPEIVTLAAGQTATATVTVAIPSDAEASDLPVDVDLVATPQEESRDLSLSVKTGVTVDNVYRAELAAGTGDGTHAWPIVTVRLGATVEFANVDNVDHRIHSGYNDAGFSHQPSPGATSWVYPVTITQAGVYNQFYCHEHGAGTGNGVITVVE